MTIEISGVPNRPVNDKVETPSATGSQTVGRTVGANGSPRGDQVSLTSSAALLQELEKEVAALPVVDSARVESVQRALATGEFQVDPARTADKLLQLEIVLGGKD